MFRRTVAALLLVGAAALPAHAYTAEDAEEEGLTCGYAEDPDLGVAVVEGGPWWVVDVFDDNEITPSHTPAPGTTIQVTCMVQVVRHYPQPDAMLGHATSRPMTGVGVLPPTTLRYDASGFSERYLCTIFTWVGADGQFVFYPVDFDRQAPGVQCS